MPALPQPLQSQSCDDSGTRSLEDNYLFHRRVGAKQPIFGVGPQEGTGCIWVIIWCQNEFAAECSTTCLVVPQVKKYMPDELLQSMVDDGDESNAEVSDRRTSSYSPYNR